MKNPPRMAALLLIFCPLFILAQNPSAQPPAAAPNSILNLYDAFGYQKRGTVLDWGFSALIRYNGKIILFDTGKQRRWFRAQRQGPGRGSDTG
jgi:hypothetical protein